MAKQVIVVVHGVGVKQAGVSADLLSTALQKTPEGVAALTREDMSEERLRPHSSDDFDLRELKQYDTRGLRQTFPARIRRYRQYQTADQGAITNERVVADFYWGDVAAIGSGVAGVLVALFKMILGLSHAIRENARDVFPAKHGLDRWMRRVTSAAVLAIHGPIAAINAVLILGALLAWAMHAALGMTAEAVAVQAALPVALLAIGLGLAALRLSYAYLARHFFSWIVMTGLVLLAFSLAGLLPADPFAASDAWLQATTCYFVVLGDAGSCTEPLTGLPLYALRLLALVSLCWLWVFILALLTGVAVLRRQNDLQERHVSSLLMPAIGLMTLLWFLMIASIWAAVGTLAEAVIPYPATIRSGLWGLVPALAALLALLGAAGMTWRRHGELTDLKAEDYLANPEHFAERHRLIVSRGMMGVLVAFLITMLVLSLGAGAYFLVGDDFVLAPLYDAIVRAIPYAMGVAALVGPLVIGSLRNAFAAGIGILTDVLTYLNDYSWDSEGVFRGTNAGAEASPVRSSRTLVERALDWPKPKPAMPTPHGYWLRGRIQDRLKVLVDQLIRDERPKELAIVSHSQGTVIAIDVVDQEGTNWLRVMPEGGRIKLVTMGSPYTHLHHHYFPSSFRSHHERAALRKRDHTAGGSTQNGGVLSDWVNIFRLDDFVGTFIDSPSQHGAQSPPKDLWPRERPVAPNGHTMYWVDENVFPILRKTLGLRSG